jgi:ubiquinol-cytochrome c reductase iron-sulfur subunit
VITTERAIVGLLAAAIVASIGLTLVYVAGGQPQLEGALLGVSLGAMGASVVLWANHLFGTAEVTEERPTLESTEEERRAFVEAFEKGERQFARRKFLSRMLAGAAGAFGVALLFPIRSLGPATGDALTTTAWRRGVRLVGPDGNPVRHTDLQVGSAITVFPEGARRRDDSATMLVRVDPEQLVAREGREDWAVEGNVAYSKICTHVGCPVGLYREATHDLLCPCHQSTFDVLDGARPVFGPATRSLPQLPLDVDGDGYLVARSDYQEPIGPAFWDREKR